ncbi:MAG TPA: hypothetical protein VFH88_01665 [Candidatus Krumholzibacteria bacterium]|nr:hypothetical protein [Candidatus Krumholzibacteria bacterium]
MSAEGALSISIDQARARIRWSHGIFFGSLLVQGAILAVAVYVFVRRGDFSGELTLQQLTRMGILEVLVSAYIFWAAFWGVPVVWEWWRRVARGAMPESAARWLRRLIPLNLIVYLWFYCAILAVGTVYGTFGGGLWQYVKARNLARGFSGHDQEAVQ